MRGARLSASLLLLAFLQAASTPAMARLVGPDAADAHCRCSVVMECCKKGFCPADRSGQRAIASCESSRAEAPPPLVEVEAIPVRAVAALRSPTRERTEFARVLRREASSPSPATPPPRDRT